MRKILNLAVSLIILLASLNSNAECDWSTGIKKTDAGYLYNSECHGKVGVLVKDLEDREKEVISLRKTIELKDLIIVKADERTILWRNESYEQFDRLQKQSAASDYNKTLWFVLGIVVTSAAVYGAGQLR